MSGKVVLLANSCNAALSIGKGQASFKVLPISENIASAIQPKCFSLRHWDQQRHVSLVSSWEQILLDYLIMPVWIVADKILAYYINNWYTLA